MVGIVALQRPGLMFLRLDLKVQNCFISFWIGFDSFRKDLERPRVGKSAMKIVGFMP